MTTTQTTTGWTETYRICRPQIIDTPTGWTELHESGCDCNRRPR